jgi:hypothetical protein
MLLCEFRVGYIWDTSRNTDVVESRSHYGDAMEYCCRHLVVRYFSTYTDLRCMHELILLSSS